MKIFRVMRGRTASLLGLLAVLGLTAACTTAGSASGQTTPAAEAVAPQGPEAPADWNEFYNSGAAEAEAVYAQGFRVLDGKGGLISDLQPLKTYLLGLKEQTGLLEKAEYQADLPISRRMMYRMAVHPSRDNPQKGVALMTSFSLQGNRWVRAVEYISFFSRPGDFDEEKVLGEVAERRKSWTGATEGQDAAALVKEFYTSDGVWAPGRQFYRGREQVIREYSVFVNRPGYSVRLKADHLRAVDNERLLEFGTWTLKGGGSGKYLLVWVKMAEGWQILLDANP